MSSIFIYRLWFRARFGNSWMRSRRDEEFAGMFSAEEESFSVKKESHRGVQMSSSWLDFVVLTHKF